MRSSSGAGRGEGGAGRRRESSRSAEWVAARPTVQRKRAVLALGGQVRVIRQGLESRVGVKMRGSHPVVAWTVEHAADAISKYEAGSDGRTMYERMSGKPCSHEIVEFGGRIRYRCPKGSRRHEETMEHEWGEGSSWESAGEQEKHSWEHQRASDGHLQFEERVLTVGTRMGYYAPEALLVAGISKQKFSLGMFELVS